MPEGRGTVGKSASTIRVSVFENRPNLKENASEVTNDRNDFSDTSIMFHALGPVDRSRFDDSDSKKQLVEVDIDKGMEKS